MKSVFMSILFVILFTSSVFSQGRNCNRAVDTKSYESKLIKEVCIPDGYVINLILSDGRYLDLDGDSLGDFVITYAKPELKDGDTIFMSVYKKVSDSNYVFLKTFGNIYPVHLTSYNSPPKDTTLDFIFNCYADRYPLINLDISSGVLEFTLRIDAVSGYLLRYQYHSKRKNWYLVSYKEWMENDEGSRDYWNKDLPEKPESIDLFSYERYLCPELISEGNQKRKKK